MCALLRSPSARFSIRPGGGGGGEGAGALFLPEQVCSIKLLAASTRVCAHRVRWWTHSAPPSARTGHLRVAAGVDHLLPVTITLDPPLRDVSQLLLCCKCAPRSAVCASNLYAFEARPSQFDTAQTRKCFQFLGINIDSITKINKTRR